MTDDQMGAPQPGVSGGTRGISTPGPAPSGWGLTKRHKSYGVLALLLFLILGIVGYRWATSSALATLIQFSGQPQRDTAAAVKEWFRAEKGDDFEDGDGARTPADSEAHFRISGGARLRLKPASQIRFKRNESGKRGSIGLQVEVGEADVRTDAGTLSLDSEFGPIFVEANSSVTLSRKGENLVLSVDLGTIEIGEQGRALGAGESIELEIGGIEVDLPEQQPEPEPKPEEEESDEELDFADGIKAFDLTVDAGATFVVHDPKPPTGIGFRIQGVCKGPARLTSGSLKTEAGGTVGLPFARGRHEYEVRCIDTPDRVAAKGKVNILRDSGMRHLPAFTPSASVATDGRKYTVLYQQRLPEVTVTWPSAPQASGYTLTTGSRTINTASHTYTFRPGALPPGTHQLTFAAATDPPRQSRTTTVHVVYDTQAPAARVSDPPSGYSAGSSVTVAGQALPGWTVSVNGKQLEMDGQRRFSGQISAGKSLPIAFSHPTHGMHYYLRRSGSR